MKATAPFMSSNHAALCTEEYLSQTTGRPPSAHRTLKFTVVLRLTLHFASLSTSRLLLPRPASSPRPPRSSPDLPVYPFVRATLIGRLVCQLFSWSSINRLSYRVCYKHCLLRRSTRTWIYDPPLSGGYGNEICGCSKRTGFLVLR